MKLTKEDIKKLPDGTAIFWNNQYGFAWHLYIKRFGRLFIVDDIYHLWAGEIESIPDEAQDYELAPQWLQEIYKHSITR